MVCQATSCEEEHGVARLRLPKGAAYEDIGRVESGLDAGTVRAGVAGGDLAEHHRKAPCQRASDRSALRAYPKKTSVRWN